MGTGSSGGDQQEAREERGRECSVYTSLTTRSSVRVEGQESTQYKTMILNMGKQLWKTAKEILGAKWVPLGERRRMKEIEKEHDQLWLRLEKRRRHAQHESKEHRESTHETEAQLK